jgi:hypothetical protein
MRCDEQSLQDRPTLERRGTHARPAASFLLLLFVCLGPASLLPEELAQGGDAKARAATHAPTPAFDAERAFAHVRKLVEFGPRPAGSEALKRARAYIVSELKSYGLKVTTDEFKAKTPEGEARMANVSAEIRGTAGDDFVVIASHYDTKLYKEFRFVGANDGGSSTGVVMEVARSLASKKQQPELTYWFVFFDGEEAVCKEWDECETPDGPDNTYGSRRYVARLREGGELDRVDALILLDMIGYTNLAIPREGYSTPWLTDIIWEAARTLGHGAQFPNTREFVEDDHVAFLRAGVPVVDLIQLSGYPHWHTEQDTLDKISPRSLQVVGETVLASLPRIEEHLKRDGDGKD